MAAIERRYGSDHRQQIFQMELTNRCQRTNETLQEYAAEIERLAHLAYAKETADFVEKMKCQAFIRGIRDPDTKRAAYLTPKGTFAETLYFALTQETAALLSKPVHKIHRVEVEEPTSLEETIRRIIRESFPQFARPRSLEIKCYNCGKAGHIARSCRIPRSQPKTSSGGRKQKTLERNHFENRKEEQHGKADSLPRRPGDIEGKDCPKVERSERIVNIRSIQLQPDDKFEPSVIRRSQLSDPDLGKIMEARDAGKRPSKTGMAMESPEAKAYWVQWNSLKIIDGVLHRVWESEDGNQCRNLIIVPKSKITSVLEEFHNGPSGGHLGITKTLEKIKQRFYWVNCRKSVAEWIRNCAQCMTARGPKERSRGRLVQYKMGSPAKTIFGSDLRLPGDLAFGRGATPAMDEGSHWETLQSDMDELHHNVRQHTQLMSNKMKDRFDRAVNSEGFSEGDLVLLYNPQRKKGASPKLQASWEGPYKVIKRLNDVVYRIQQCKTGQGKVKVVHLERLAPFGSKDLVSNRDDQT